jgi:hypothetical protein
MPVLERPAVTNWKSGRGSRAAFGGSSYRKDLAPLSAAFSLTALGANALTRLITVSNRVGAPSAGSLRAGGLEAAIREALRAEGGIWFGWSGEAAEARSDAPKIARRGNVTFATVDLSRADYEEYYLGYANSTLWPLLHYQLGLIEFHRAQFKGYIAVNEYFAKMLRPMIRPDDLIWVHDYHLIPLASELRKLGVKNRIGFFLHTPMPPTDILVALPNHEMIMRALCCYDLIGLQTETGVRAFLDYMAREANGHLEIEGSLSAYDMMTKVVQRGHPVKAQPARPRPDHRRRPDGLQQRHPDPVRGDRRAVVDLAGAGREIHLSADLADLPVGSRDLSGAAAGNRTRRRPCER